MPGMPDEKDMPALGNQAFGLAVNLRNERARRVDIAEAAIGGLGGHGLRHAMGRKDDRPVVGDLVELVDENRAHLAQPVHNEAVVDDFMADIDGRAKPLERQLNDLDGPVNARAKAARRRDQDSQRGSVQHSDSHVSLRLQP